MKISSAEFLKSSSTVTECPPNGLLDIAFIGRSNVGKSSLINMLLSRKGLAKTSQTPGKTQLINHFLINKTWHLVDLPGYGWASANKKIKESWDSVNRDYIIHRKQLELVCVLIDSRLPPQIIDINFLTWLGVNEIPVILVFTKADKLKKLELQKNVSLFLDNLKLTWEVLPKHFITSSQTNLGREDFLNYIDKVFSLQKKN